MGDIKICIKNATKLYQIYYEIRKNVDETTIWDTSKL